MAGISSKAAGKLENRFKYNGKEKDTELDLNWYNYGFRMYDPQIGRFPSTDPIADQFSHVSPYNYAENEPVGSIDLWGLQRWIVNGRERTSAMPRSLTDARAIGFAIRHPRAALRIGEIQRGSTNISSVAGRISRHLADNGNMTPGVGAEQNALRHALWGSMIRSNFTEGISRRATNAHEGVGITDQQQVDFTRPFNGRDIDLADHIVDVLNNEIGFGIATANPNTNSATDLAVLALDEFLSNGLWTATRDDKGNINISRTRITQEQYDNARNVLNTLDVNGFTATELNEIIQERLRMQRDE